MEQIAQDVYAFADMGANVLSPADPRVVDAFGHFLYVASDVQRAVKVLQNRHLAAIESASLLWLVAPDGDIGTSAAAELGAAVMARVPVFSQVPLNDVTWRQYVEVVPTASHAVTRIRALGARDALSSEVPLIVDPHEGAQLAYGLLSKIERSLTRPSREHGEQDPLLTASVARLRALLRHL
jgi:hypothetical protein